MGIADILIVAVIVALALAYVILMVRKSLREKTCAGCASSSCPGRQAVSGGLSEIKPRAVCPHCAEAGAGGQGKKSN